LQIHKHGYSDDLYFIILFAGILPLYALNLSVVSLLSVSSFIFLRYWWCYYIWCILPFWI